MITSETPYKLAEIIRDTWPGIYMRPYKDDEDKLSNIKKNENYISKISKFNLHMKI